MMIRTDSRKVMPGDTFVALDGHRSNGSEYIDKAIANGAARIVCRKGDFPVETVHAEDTRKWLEENLEAEYGDIISQMRIVGVTGTNGKTSTCYFFYSAMNMLGIKCAYLGTIGFFMDGKVRDLPNTSVDICDLYEYLLEAHDKGYDTVALEASSQGLDMGRLNTISFDAAVFTNLTEDHIDYHKTFEQYALAKQLLFKKLKKTGAAIVNENDKYKDYFLLEENNNLTFGFGRGDYNIEEYRFEEGHTDFRFSFEGKAYDARINMLGTYNIQNIICMIAMMHHLGVEFEDILRVLPDIEMPVGRYNIFMYGTNRVIVDYSHTPDAMEKIIDSVKGITKGNIYAVFGCPGSRDRVKRPMMLDIALSNCKYCIITVDDLNDEFAASILNDMFEGNTKTNYETILNRKRAIHRGFELLEDNDTLLVLGKGHEDFIKVGTLKVPHNDVQVVTEYIEKHSK